MSDTFRFTITVTPLTEAELQSVVDDIRRRFGRKPLIHVIGQQSSGSTVSDARAIAAAAPAGGTGDPR